VETRTILFVHPSDELYGSDRCLLDLLRLLPECYRAIVLLPTDVAYEGGLSRELEALGIEVRFVEMAVMRRMWLRPRHLPSLARSAVRGVVSISRIIRDEDVCVVHSNTLAVPCGAVAAALSRRGHIWHVHEMLSAEPRAVRWAYSALVSVLPGRVIAVSSAVAVSLTGGSRRLAARTEVVYDGVTIPQNNRNTRSNGDVSRLAIIGRLTPRKGIREGIFAAAILQMRGVPFHLAIVGGTAPGQEGRRDEYRALVARLGLEDCVTICAFEPDARARMLDTDVLVVPSQRPEPLGLVILEGMAAGCAIVACRNGGGSDELLRDGVSGLYCGKTPEEIADAIERLLADETLRRTLGSNARRDAQNRFSLERYIATMIRQYDDMITR
jgi:glycosyltransferase involved in cell wall biosynthesis